MLVLMMLHVLLHLLLAGHVRRQAEAGGHAQYEAKDEAHRVLRFRA
jgi:hypothetical protein